MDEFTNIAIWLLIIYLAINGSIVWFTSDSTFGEYGLGYSNFQRETAFQEGSDVVINVVGTEINCSTAQPDPFNFIPCSLANITASGSSIISNIWNLLTAWSNLMGLIFPGAFGQLIQYIIGPIFGGIAVIGIFVILLRVGGIIRGGS